MDSLTAFGLFAVTAMLVCYALESRSHWFVLLFAASCALSSAYGFLQGAWPFGLVEAIWSAVALRRWLMVRKFCRPCENCAATDSGAARAALESGDGAHHRSRPFADPAAPGIPG